MSSDFNDKPAVVLASPATRRKLARRSGKKTILYLSEQTNENLEKLRLKSLDNRGRKPTESEIIEKLINAALKNEPEAPYPTDRRSR